MSHTQVLCGGFASCQQIPHRCGEAVSRKTEKKGKENILCWNIKLKSIWSLFKKARKKKNNPHLKNEIDYKFLQKIVLRGLDQTLSSPQWIFKILCHFSHSRTPCPSVGSLTWTKPSTGSGDQCPAVSQPGLLPTGEGWGSRGMPDFQPVAVGWECWHLSLSPYPSSSRLERRLPLSPACLR